VINRERKFLESHGVRLSKIGGDVILDPREQAAMEPEYWYKKAQEAWDGESDGLFISCAGIRVSDMIPSIEKSIGRPVVASNQAAMWACLRLMGLKDSVQGFGRLLAEVA
jgi:maleate cis-trans isomerase